MTYQRISPAGIIIDDGSSTYQRLPVDGVSVGEIPVTETLPSHNLSRVRARESRQPSYSPQVEWDNPITNGLKALVSANTAYDPVGKRALTPVNGAFRTYGGRGIALSSGYLLGGMISSYSTVPQDNGPNKSLVALINLPVAGNAARLANMYSAASSWFMLEATATGFKSTMKCSWAGYGDLTREVSSSQTGDMVVSATLGSLRSKVHAGTQIDATGTTYASADNGGMLPCYMKFLEQIYDPLSVYMVAYFARTLSVSDHLSLNQNPWQLFRQSPTRSYFYARPTAPAATPPTKTVGIITSKNRQGPPKLPAIDWNSPFADYLRAAVCISNDQPVEVLRGMPFKPINSPQGTASKKTRYGAQRFAINQVYDGAMLCDTGPLMRSASSSLATAVLSYRVASLDWGDITAIGFSGTTGLPISLRISESSNGGPSIELLLTGPVGVNRIAATGYVAGVPLFFGGYRSGTTLDLYMSGAISNGTGSTSANALYNVPNKIYLNGKSASNENLDGGTAFAVLAEGVTDASGFFRELNKNPWQIFRERVPRSYLIPGVAPGSTYKAWRRWMQSAINRGH